MTAVALPHTLTAIVLTYNEARHIADCLASLRFADRVIVFDSGSTDDTVTLAREAGAEVMTRPFDHYAGQRNAALEALMHSTKWVLFVDADEQVTLTLADEIRSSLDSTAYAGFRIPRHNMIFGRLTLGAGWYPDYQTRLLRVGAARYDPAYQVHEVVLLDGDTGTLHQPLLHENYSTVEEFFAKQRRYAQLDARMAHERGERPRRRHFVGAPLRQFWWRFVTLRGFSDGLHGLRLSALMAWYVLYKLIVLRRLWVAHDRTPSAT